MAANTKYDYTQETLEASFNYLLDGDSPSISVAGVDFYPSDVLKKLDPIAYRCAVADYADILAGDGYSVEGH